MSYIEEQDLPRFTIRTLSVTFFVLTVGIYMYLYLDKINYLVSDLYSHKIAF